MDASAWSALEKTQEEREEEMGTWENAPHYWIPSGSCSAGEVGTESNKKSGPEESSKNYGCNSHV